MTKIDSRLLTAVLTIDDKKININDLHMTCNIVRVAAIKDNKCDLKIYNLNKDTRNYILSNASELYSKPNSPKKIPPSIEVYAGYLSTGLYKIFEGEITKASVGQRPDISLDIEAKTAQTARTLFVAKTYSQKINMKSILDDIAKTYNLILIFEATDRDIANYSFTGSLSQQIANLAIITNASIYIDNRNLIAQDKNIALENAVKVVNKKTGMLEVPFLNEYGVVVKTLFDGGLKLGGTLRLTSEENPTTDGDWVVKKLTYQLSNFDNDFYMQIESGIPAKKEKKAKKKKEASEIDIRANNVLRYL